MKLFLEWEQSGKQTSAYWVSNGDFPSRVRPLEIDDTFTAQEFYRKASEGAVFLWQGDFQNAKNLLAAVQRRIDKQAERKPKTDQLTPTEIFHIFRQKQSHKAQLMSRLLIPVNGDLQVTAPRAPNTISAIQNGLIETHTSNFYISLRELLGMIGADEWRKKGVWVDELQGHVFPYYGVYSPSRGEYLKLIADAPAPLHAKIAFDIGTGTGVLACLLAKKNIPKIIATDNNPKAVACAKFNVEHFGLTNIIETQLTDKFPEGTADLIVCNPPWLPAKPTSTIETALYDHEHKMLRWFLKTAPNHMHKNSQLWLIMSDLAEHLELRKPGEMENWISENKLKIQNKTTTQPKHSKSKNTEDPLYFARSKETTSIYVLVLN